MDVKAPPDSLSASWLAVRLGLEPRKIEAMRRAGELIAYRPDNAHEYYYPVWQFDDDSGPAPAYPVLTPALLVTAAVEVQ